MHRNSYNVIVKKSFRAIEVSGAGSHEEATPVDENHDRKQLATIDSFRNVDIEDEAVFNANDRILDDFVLQFAVNSSLKLSVVVSFGFKRGL
jgi:hypothetical protein